MPEWASVTLSVLFFLWFCFVFFILGRLKGFMDGYKQGRENSEQVYESFRKDLEKRNHNLQKEVWQLTAENKSLLNEINELEINAWLCCHPGCLNESKLKEDVSEEEIRDALGLPRQSIINPNKEKERS